MCISSSVSHSADLLVPPTLLDQNVEQEKHCTIAMSNRLQRHAWSVLGSGQRNEVMQCDLGEGERLAIFRISRSRMSRLLWSMYYRRNPTNQLQITTFYIGACFKSWVPRTDRHVTMGVIAYALLQSAYIDPNAPEDPSHQ